MVLFVVISEKFIVIRLWVVLVSVVVLLVFFIEMKISLVVGNCVFVFICVFRKVCVKLWFYFIILLVECIFGFSSVLILGKWVKGSIVFLIENYGVFGLVSVSGLVKGRLVFGFIFVG